MIYISYKDFKTILLCTLSNSANNIFFKKAQLTEDFLLLDYTIHHCLYLEIGSRIKINCSCFLVTFASFISVVVTRPV